MKKNIAIAILVILLTGTWIQKIGEYKFPYSSISKTENSDWAKNAKVFLGQAHIDETSTTTSCCIKAGKIDKP